MSFETEMRLKMDTPKPVIKVHTHKRLLACALEMKLQDIFCCLFLWLVVFFFFGQRFHVQARNMK